MTMLVKYEQPVYKAGDHRKEFTFRGDLQMTHYKSESQLMGLIMTLYYEKSKHKIIEYAFYDNRAKALPYPANIIVHKIGDVLMHNNTELYPDRVFIQLDKYKFI